MAFLLPAFLSEALGAVGFTEAISTTSLELGASQTVATNIGRGITGLAAGELSNQILTTVPDRVDRFNESLKRLSKTGFFEQMNLTGKRKTGVIDLTKNPLNDPNNTHSDNNVSDDLQTVPSDIAINVAKGIDKAKFTTQQVAHFITTFASEVAQRAMNNEPINETEIINKMVNHVPNHEELASMLGSFIANKVPDNEEYRKIAQVYNGKNLTMANCITRYDRVVQGLVHTFIDELGNKSVFDSSKTKISLPQIYGNFFGPASSGKTGGAIDLLDLFALSHDISYLEDGYFSRTADYKFISRITQNYTRLSLQAQPFARLAVAYFSTVGHLASGLLGSLPPDVSVQKKEQFANDDLFTALGGTIDDKQGRTEFYKELENDIKTIQAQTSILSAGSYFQRVQLLKEFENMVVEVN